MPQTPPHLLRLADQSARKPLRFALEPDADTLAQIAQELGLETLRKARLAGTLAPRGKQDWLLEAQLGATAVQACVVTLAPVTTRVDAPLRRLFSAQWQAPEDAEAEMPDDTDVEPLPAEVDLHAILTEALGLALPDFPRAEGAELGESVYSAPGVAPMRDEDTKPFAGLAALRDQLGTDAKDSDE